MKYTVMSFRSKISNYYVSGALTYDLSNKAFKK